MKDKTKNRSSSSQEPSGRHSKDSITKYKHDKGLGVKRNLHLQLHPPRPKQGFRMLHLVLRRPSGDECVYFPACARCGFAILDLSMANISVWNESDDFTLTPLGWQEETGCHVFLTKGDVYAFHKECDNSPSGSAWVNADIIFKSDQRHAFERRWEREASRRRRRSAHAIPLEGQQSR